MSTNSAGGPRPDPHVAPLHVGGAYFANTSGFWRCTRTRPRSTFVQLSNFLARIILETVLDDDSSEPRREYTVEACIVDEVPIKFTVSAIEFDRLTWVVTHLGARAVVFPGFQSRDHIAAAIRLVSDKIPKAICYGHLGWRKIDGKWAFLHAGGAVRAFPHGHDFASNPSKTQELAVAGPIGPMSTDGENIMVRLDPALEDFVLPPPPSGDELRDAITSSLLFLDVASDGVTLPLYGSLWRSVLGDVRFAVHCDGPSGSRKTELAAILQRHFGTLMKAQRLPANWSSTANSLEQLAHLAKDCLLTVDDYFPSTAAEAARLNREADRLIRNAANGAGRGRARPDGTNRRTRSPRALILSTGEVGLQGRSLNARTMGVEVAPNDVNLRLLTALQREADRGRLAQAMSGFIAWLAPQLDDARSEMADYIEEARQEANRSVHGRTTDQAAEIAFALALFLDFAMQAGAITQDYRNSVWERLGRAFESVSAVQQQKLTSSDPVELYLEALRESIAMGRAHLAGSDGGAPGECPEKWGWVRSMRPAGEPDEEPRAVWSPRGDRVGWTDEIFACLMPEASLAVAERLCRDTGKTIAISSERVLGRMLAAKGLLERTDEKRNKFTVRRTLQGARQNVYELSAESLMNTKLEDYQRISTDFTLNDVLNA